MKTSKFKYTDAEKEINSVLKYQADELEKISFPSTKEIDKNIQQSEDLLKTLGVPLPDRKIKQQMNVEKGVVVRPSWEEILAKAEASVGTDVIFEDLFTEEELKANEQAIQQLNLEYNQLYKLDKYDILISAAAGLLGAAVDILLVGVPQKTSDGLKGAPLSNYIRDYFDKQFPTGEMEKLAHSKVSHVPYDAQDNRNTTIRVEGLSAITTVCFRLDTIPCLGWLSESLIFLPVG